jgi:hypothetical protein
MQSKEYLLHLIGEVSNYILESQPHRMVISLHQQEDGMHLCVLDDHVRPDTELEDMSKALNTPARPEMAEYYGSMGGSDMLGAARLNLVGWQIKHADVSRLEEGGTKIDLWLGSERFDASYFTIPKDVNTETPPKN